MICSAILRTGLVVAVLALVGGCGGDKPNTTSAGGSTATGGTGPNTGGTNSAGDSGTAGSSSTTGGSSTSGGTTAAGGTGAAAGAGGTSGGATGVGGTSGGTGNTPFVYWVKQTNGTTSASIAGGIITVNNTYSSSGNAFKYVQPNYYGTNSNGFIAFPTTMSGDFSIEAQVTITTQNKSNNSCGIGLGLTTGFNATDMYSYILMRNANNSTSGYYVSGSGAISAGIPTVAFTNGTPLQLTFNRTGSNVTLGAGLVSGTATTQTVAASALTDGTTVYGTGPVYPAISFNNVAATITKLLIKDASGATVYDSDTGGLVQYIPASLAVSQIAASMKKGASTTVLATAVAIGGAVSTVTARAADSTIVDVTVANGTTNSTINLTGLKGGVTTLTITNTGDTNTVTNTKTVTVSVNDYPTSDTYGSLATVAYPAPGAINAYTDGELALTFDSAPTLNAGGSIKIFKADGTEADSISFAGETQLLASTSISVGSQLARISGNTVYFAPHVGKLAYSTGYYVVIPTTSITGTLNGTAFNGFSDASTVATWNFTTRAAPTLDAANVTVDGAQSSTANYRTVQGALGGITANLSTATSVTINVAAGTYNELLRYTSGLGTGQTIRIVGPPGNNKGDTCVIQWANGNGMNGSTATRASFYFNGANLILENITLKNTALRSAVSQAETLYFSGGATGTTLAAHNCSFYSNQDTLQTSGRNWFYNCYIEGNVDFLWGTADAALFENCDMRFVNDLAGAAATYNLVVARTGTTIAATANGTIGKGYVVLNSTVSVDANVTAYFGRDAGTGAYYDQVALLNVTFSGAGTIGTGLWTTTTAPLSLGDASYVGWKSVGCSGLNIASLTTATGTSATIAEQATEFDTRDHILNRVVTVTAGAPSGYQATAATAWDVSSLATAWGAP